MTNRVLRDGYSWLPNYRSDAPRRGPLLQFGCRAFVYGLRLIYR